MKYKLEFDKPTVREPQQQMWSMAYFIFVGPTSPPKAMIRVSIKPR